MEDTATKYHTQSGGSWSAKTLVLRSTVEDRVALLLLLVYITVVGVHASTDFSLFIGLLLPVLVLQLVLLFHVYFSLAAKFGVADSSRPASMFLDDESGFDSEYEPSAGGSVSSADQLQ